MLFHFQVKRDTKEEKMSLTSHLSLRKALQKQRVIENLFFYFSTKTYVVGTQKIRLNETDLLSTPNKCLN